MANNGIYLHTCIARRRKCYVFAIKIAFSSVLCEYCEWKNKGGIYFSYCIIEIEYKFARQVTRVQQRLMKIGGIDFISDGDSDVC